jgi:dihydrolipoamide dehydrogenase
MEEFDLIVVGSGSGLDVASGIASRGKNVAVLEPGRLGGTCLNRGCIPSKMLIHRADILEEIKESEKFDIDSEINKINFEEIIKEVNEDVHGDAEEIEKGLKSSENHTLFKEAAEFEDENVLKLKDSGKKITADKIVVAAGSRPLIPPIEGVEDVEFWVSTDALNPDYRPESLVIIGGGYISLELAHFYDAMGTKVTILEMEDRLLKREDRDISEKITEIAKDRYNVELNVSATEIAERKEEKAVKAETQNGEKTEFTRDEILIAAGRRPNTDSMKVEEAGIETTDREFIETDEKMKTNVEGIYALGDIADNWMFKHSANLEAELVYKNIVSGDEYTLDDLEMPHAVFTSPQIAGIGKTEQELEESDHDYVKASYHYSDTGMGKALKEEDGFVKVLASNTGEILGCHIIGPEASTLIHEVNVAIKSGSKDVRDIQDTIHIHPALNEVVKRAFDNI